MKIGYQEIDLENVVRYFVKGFEAKKKSREKLVDYEFFFDPLKGKIVFKLFIDENDNKPG